jgi:hypothetical protein
MQMKMVYTIEWWPAESSSIGIQVYPIYEFSYL